MIQRSSMPRSLTLCLALALCAALPALAADCPTPIAADTGLPLPVFDTSTSDDQVAVAAGDTETILAYCDASATCLDGSTISCNVTAPAVDCSSFDSECGSAFGIPGWVECNGQRTTCLDRCNPKPPQTCSAEGLPCSSDSYCRAKCGQYCSIDAGICFYGNCICSQFGE